MKIVHLADLHLGYKAYNKLNERGLNIREADLFTAFKNALEKMEEINPDLILIAGDVFHKPRPSNFTILMTIRFLQQFRKNCDAPIIVIAGNHEYVKLTESGSVLSILESVISGLKVFDKEAKCFRIDHLDTNILCIPHAGLENINKTDLNPDKTSKYNIMMIHGIYKPNKLKALPTYGGAMIADDFIDESKWDYIAFGHYHKFTELAPNAYYSGAIERTTSNIWQEANDKKGFIVYDFDKRECKHISLSSPRKVIDIKKISAKDLTAVEINQKIDEEISKIYDIDKCIVRMTVENVDPVAMREIDYKKIREIKKTAVHFRLNLIKKDFTVDKDENGQPIQHTKGVFEYLDEELAEFELSQGVDKDKFSKLAKEYLVAVNQV